MSAGSAAAPAPRIAVLDALVADQIAAGEVVERPASVVKELVENALDAGARAIARRRSRTAVALHRRRDDGSGMAPDDARLAFAAPRDEQAAPRRRSRAHRRRLGFRGEALPSIAVGRAS